MQATHGSAVSFRSRGRLIGCLMALALALSAVVFAPAANAVTPETKTYLALGDSLAFGYTQEKFEANFPNESPTLFEKGYVDYYAKKVVSNKAEKANKGLVKVDNGCPGETSGGLLGSEPPTCAYQKAGLPLHNPYPGHSQIESALSVLKGGAPAHPIPVVSLNIGANDELAAVNGCVATVKKEFEEKGESVYGKEPGGAINNCVASNAKALFEKIATHIGETLGAIDSIGKYTGPIVVLGYYNPDTFILPGSDVLQKVLNETIEKEVIPKFPNAVYANPLAVFNPAPEGSLKEKNAICRYTEMCNAKDIAVNKANKEESNEDEVEEGKTVIFPFNGEGDIHPTQKGYEALAKKMFEVAPV